MLCCVSASHHSSHDLSSLCPHKEVQVSLSILVITAGGSKNLNLFTAQFIFFFSCFVMFCFLLCLGTTQYLEGFFFFFPNQKWAFTYKNVRTPALNPQLHLFSCLHTLTDAHINSLIKLY